MRHWIRRTEGRVPRRREGGTGCGQAERVLLSSGSWPSSYLFTGSCISCCVKGSRKDSSACDMRRPSSSSSADSASCIASSAKPADSCGKHPGRDQSLPAPAMGGHHPSAEGHKHRGHSTIDGITIVVTALRTGLLRRILLSSHFVASFSFTVW